MMIALKRFIAVSGRLRRSSLSFLAASSGILPFWRATMYAAYQPDQSAIHRVRRFYQERIFGIRAHVRANPARPSLCSHGEAIPVALLRGR
jgi:hypothetical protein